MGKTKLSFFRTDTLSSHYSHPVIGPAPEENDGDDEVGTDEDDIEHHVVDSIGLNRETQRLELLNKPD